MGFATSAGLRAVKSCASGNRVFLCSYGSTVAGLTGPGDYVIRIVPPSNVTARASARFVHDYGIRYLYVMYRDDAWGRSEAEDTAARFKELGGTVLGMLGYSPDKIDFTSELAAVSSAVDAAVRSYGSSGTEAAQVLLQAQGYHVLLGVTWFGSDGTATNAGILEQAGQVLARVRFLSPAYTPAESPKHEEFLRRVEARIGGSPPALTVLNYDCVWLLGLSIIRAGKYDGEAIKRVIGSVASAYYGISGWTLLDQNGDRASGDFGIWCVALRDGKPSWERIAVVNALQDAIVWLKRP